MDLYNLSPDDEIAIRMGSIQFHMSLIAFKLRTIQMMDDKVRGGLRITQTTGLFEDTEKEVEKSNRASRNFKVRRIAKGAFFFVVACAAAGTTKFLFEKVTGVNFDDKAEAEQDAYRAFRNMRRALNLPDIPDDPFDFSNLDDVDKLFIAANGELQEFANQVKARGEAGAEILRLSDPKYQEELERGVQINDLLITIKNYQNSLDELEEIQAKYYGDGVDNENLTYYDKIVRAVTVPSNETLTEDIAANNKKEDQLFDQVRSITVSKEEYAEAVEYVFSTDVETIANNPVYRKLERVKNLKYEFRTPEEFKAAREKAAEDVIQAAILNKFLDPSALENGEYYGNQTEYTAPMQRFLKKVTPEVMERCRNAKEAGKTCATLEETMELWREVADRTVFEGFGDFRDIQDAQIKVRVTLESFQGWVLWFFGRQYTFIDTIISYIDNIIGTLFLSGRLGDVARGMVYSIPAAFAFYMGRMVQQTLGYSSFTRYESLNIKDAVPIFGDDKEVVDNVDVFKLLFDQKGGSKEYRNALKKEGQEFLRISANIVTKCVSNFIKYCVENDKETYFHLMYNSAGVLQFITPSLVKKARDILMVMVNYYVKNERDYNFYTRSIQDPETFDIIQQKLLLAESLKDVTSYLRFILIEKDGAYVSTKKTPIAKWIDEESLNKGAPSFKKLLKTTLRGYPFGNTESSEVYNEDTMKAILGASKTRKLSDVDERTSKMLLSLSDLNYMKVHNNQSTAIVQYN